MDRVLRMGVSFVARFFFCVGGNLCRRLKSAFFWHCLNEFAGLGFDY